MDGEFFRMTDIVKTYKMGDEEQMVLKHVNLSIDCLLYPSRCV